SVLLLRSSKPILESPLMFNFLFPSRRAAKRRNIFRYFDGVRQRAIDPVAVAIAFEEHPTFSMERHVPLALAGDPESIRITVDAARQVFSIPAWSERQRGLTSIETIDLVGKYVAYMESLKKSTSDSPTSSAAMAPVG